MAVTRIIIIIIIIIIISRNFGTVHVYKRPAGCLESLEDN
jgi:hypothetical protein